MDSIKNPIESMLLKDTFLSKNMDHLGQGLIIFALLWFCLYILRGFLQYRLAKSTGHHQPWIAFFPLLNLFQWFQMGKVSLWWGSLFFVPGIISVFAPIYLAFLSLLVVFILFGILFLRASLRIAKAKKQPFLEGILLSIPLLRFGMMYWIDKKSTWIHQITHPWAQLGLIILSLAVSWVLYTLIFYLFGWISFGSLFIPFMEYLANPSISPQDVMNEVLLGTSF